MKTCLIFDLDGTLVDSAQDIAKTLNEVLQNEDRDPVTLQTVKANIGEGLRKILTTNFQDLNPEKEAFLKIEKAFYELYETECIKTTHLMEGVFDFLEQWPGPKAIVTNKKYLFAKLIFQHLNLNDYNWVCLLGGDSLAEKKPHPMPLQHVMKLAKTSPEFTIMIGDGIPDIKAAHAANCKSIALNFGYTPFECLEKLQPTAVLNSYKELPNLIENLFSIR